MEDKVEKLIKTVQTMSSQELLDTTKILNKRLDNINKYREDIEVLEEELIEKDKEKYKALRNLERKTNELYDIERELRSLRQKIDKLEHKKENLSNSLGHARKNFEEAMDNFKKAKKKLSDTREKGISGVSTLRLSNINNSVILEEYDNYNLKIIENRNNSKIDDMLISFDNISSTVK